MTSGYLQSTLEECANSPVLALLAVVTGLLALFVCRDRLFQQRGVGRLPPGPTGLPFFGSLFNLLLTRRQQHEVINDWSLRYGPIFFFKMLNTKVYVLSDMGLVSEAFHKTADISDRMTMALSDSLAGGRSNNGIVLSNGAVWKEHRRFFLTVFKKVDSSVIRFEDIIGSQANRFLDEVADHHGQAFDPFVLINTAIANIITRIVTGVTYEYDDEEFHHVIASSHRMFELMGPAGLFSTIPILSKIPSPQRSEMIENAMVLMAMIEKSIEKHRAEFDADEPPTDLIACYLKEMAQRTPENNPGLFDDINLMVTCSDTLLGGWETTTSSLSWITYTLAGHPDAQRRVRAEIVDVIGADRLPRYHDRHAMPITEATIAECMRLHPAAAFHLPHIASRDCTIGGYHVPAGSAVTSNMWYLALSPSLWEAPHEFRPDRFLDTNGHFNRKLEAMPFGYGYRACPGEHLARMEIFLFVTYILQRFHVTLPEDAPKTNYGKHGMTNKPDPFKIFAERVN